MSNLKCPLCKSETLSVEELSSAWGCGESSEHVICDQCACSAPIKSWNNRSDGWISVDTKRPSMGDKVICINSTGNISVTDRIGTGRELKTTNMDYHGKLCAVISSGWSVGITHWMPLPSAP